jgi:hypothetical protein
MLNGGLLPRSFVAKRRNDGFKLGRVAGSRARLGSGFPESAEGSGVRRRSRENANDLKSDPWGHIAQHHREGLSMPAALKEKLKPILAPKG